MVWESITQYILYTVLNIFSGYGVKGVVVLGFMFSRLVEFLL